MSTQTVTLRLVLEGQEARAEVRGTAEDVKKLEGATKAQGAGAKSVAREQAAAAKAAAAAAKTAAKEQAAAARDAQRETVDAARAAAREQAAAAKTAARQQAAAARAAAKESTDAARAAAREQAAAVKDAAAQATAAAREAARAHNQYGLTVGQQKQALRQVPAQITDIVTSLVSGQPVYQVAIQQGGQLRDSFGGIAPAASALLAAINPLTVGLVAVAAALGVVAFQAVQGYRELRAYDRALISSGNVAGSTSGELADMADRIGQATGDFAGAREAVLNLAAGGRIAGDSLQKASSAAVALAKLTGDSIDSTIGKIEEIAKSPAEALLKLNEQYNFLTPATYRQVRALEDQGRAADALRVAIDTFSDVQEKRLAEAESRAGSLERAYKRVREAFSGALDSIRDVGRNDDEYLLKQAREKLAQLESQNASFPSASAARGTVRQGVLSEARRGSLELAREEVRLLAKKVQKRASEAAAAARSAAESNKQLAAEKAQAEAKEQAVQAFDRLRISNLSKQKRLEREIAEIRDTGAKAGIAAVEIEKQVAQARARFAEQQQKPKVDREANRAAKEAAEARKSLAERLQALRDENALLAEGYTLDRARAELRVRQEAATGGIGAEALAEYLAELRELTAIQDGFLAQQQAAKDAAEEEARIRARNLQLIRETVAELEAEVAALFDGAAAAARYQAQRAKLVAQGATPEQAQDVVNLTRVRDTLQNNRGIVGLDSLNFDEVLEFSPMFDALDDLEARLESIGGTGTASLRQISIAAKAFAVASKSTGRDAFGAYTQGAAASLTAIQSMTGQGSAAFQKLGVAIAALNAVSAIQAILNQGSGDPYSAFARMASMAAIIASLGVQVAGAFGEGGGSSAPPSAIARTNLGAGTGTVLGDPAARSESIANSLDALEKYAELDLGYSAGQLQQLRAINAGINGVTSLLFRANAATGGPTPFNLATSVRDSSLSRLVNLNSISQFGNKIPVIGGFLQDVTRGLVSGIFGSTKTKQIATGILLQGGQTLGDALANGLDAVYFQTIKVTKSRLGGLVKSSRLKENTAALGAEEARQFQLVLASLAEASIAAVTSLGGSEAEARRALAQLQLGEVKVDLQGLSAEDAQKKIEAVFGAIGDTIAEQLLPAVTQFQRAGEGALETLTRVASETRIVAQRLDALGVSVGTLSGIDLAAVGQRLIELAGGIENFAENTSTYFSEFFTEDEQTESLRQQLVEAVDALGYALPAARAGFRELISSLDLTTEKGQEAFAGLTALAGAADRYYDTLDEAKERYADAADSLRSFRESIRDIAEAANGVTLSTARQRFESTGRLARLGNLEALQTLPELGRALASASLAQSSSRTDYLRDIARIQLTAAQSEAVANRLSLSDLAAKQLAEQKEQTALLESINSALTPTTGAGGSGLATNPTEVAELKAEIAELKQMLHTIATNTGKTAASTRWLEEWDAEGLPRERAA